MDYSSIKLIETNIKLLKNLSVQYKIIRKDVVKFLKEFDDFCFDLVFVDPPYRIAKEKMKNLFSLLADREKRIINNNSVIIYEYFLKRDIGEEIDRLNIIKNTYFGDKIVSYIKIKKD